jgi:hypothetical protein
MHLVPRIGIQRNAQLPSQTKTTQTDVIGMVQTVQKTGHMHLVTRIILHRVAQLPSQTKTTQTDVTITQLHFNV